MYELSRLDQVLVALQSHLFKTQTRVIDLFRKIDSSGDGNVSIEEFREGLLGFGVELSEEDYDVVRARLDKDGSGDVTLKELSRALRDAEKAADRLVNKGGPKPTMNLDATSSLLRPSHRREKRQPPPRRVQEQLPKMTRGDEVLCMIKAQLNCLKTKMLDVFRVLDESGDGTVDEKEFHLGLKKLGFDVSDEDFASVMEILDKDGSGDVSVKEFDKALKLSEKKARAEGRGAELDTFTSISSMSRVTVSDSYDWSQRSMRVYKAPTLGGSLREPLSARSWTLASGGPSEAAFTNRLHCGSFQDSSVYRQRLFDSHLPPTILPDKLTSTPRLPTHRSIYTATTSVTSRFGNLEPARLHTTKAKFEGSADKSLTARRSGPGVHLMNGVRKFQNAPQTQSHVDQVVFGHDMDFSGDSKFDEEFTAMFRGAAGKPSWWKLKEI